MFRGHGLQYRVGQTSQGEQVVSVSTSCKDLTSASFYLRDAALALIAKKEVITRRDVREYFIVLEGKLFIIIDTH